MGIGKGYSNDLSRDFVGFRCLPAGYPVLTPHGHRGVSASSFRDGAMRFYPNFRLKVLQTAIKATFS
ncbi:MAG TPA: hypothetical protein PKW46_02470, partial [Thermotogota bacterium]|nr:hypothetical protein [Thermotogota bacterium]HOM54394.1 hypothetical protein [Thermotogota bacterium]